MKDSVGQQSEEEDEGNHDAEKADKGRGKGVTSGDADEK